jgi:hypothetical protein
MKKFCLLHRQQWKLKYTCQLFYTYGRNSSISSFRKYNVNVQFTVAEMNLRLFYKIKFNIS